MPTDRHEYMRNYMRAWRAKEKERRERDRERAKIDHAACDAEIARLRALLRKNRINPDS